MQAQKAQIIKEVKKHCPSHEKEVDIYFKEVDRIYNTPLSDIIFKNFRATVKRIFTITSIEQIPMSTLSEIYAAENKVLKEHGLISFPGVDVDTGL